MEIWFNNTRLVKYYKEKHQKLKNSYNKSIQSKLIIVRGCPVIVTRYIRQVKIFFLLWDLPLAVAVTEGNNNWYGFFLLLWLLVRCTSWAHIPVEILSHEVVYRPIWHDFLKFRSPRTQNLTSWVSFFMIEDEKLNEVMISRNLQVKSLNNL